MKTLSSSPDRNSRFSLCHMAARTGTVLEAADLPDPARSRPNSIFRIAALASLLLFFEAYQATAADFTWTGAGGPDWQKVVNWSPQPFSAPGIKDTVTFGPSGQRTSIYLLSGTAVDVLRFTSVYSDGPSYTIGAVGPVKQVLTLANGGEIRNDAAFGAHHTINADVLLGQTADQANYLIYGASRNLGIDFNGGVSGPKNGPAGSKILRIEGSGVFKFNGSISNGGASSLSLLVDGPTVQLGTPKNYYTGPTILKSGSIVFGESGVIPDKSNMLVYGGLLRTGGFDDIAGTLTLLGDALFDFADGDSSLEFSDSSEIPWSGLMGLRNFDIAADSLRFGTSGDGLADEQLSRIRLSGYSASLDDEGYVRFTAVPEPRIWTLALIGLFVFITRRRAIASVRWLHIALICFAPFLSEMRADSIKWAATGGTSWNDAKNWSAQRIPGLNDDVWFDGSRGTTVDLGPGASIHDLNLSSGRGLQYKIGVYPIGSQTLTFQDTGGLYNSSSMDGGVTFVADIVLGGNGTTGQYLFAYYSRGVSVDFLGGVSGSGSGPKEMNLTGSAAYNFSGSISTGDSEWLSISIYDNVSPTTFYAQNTYIGTTTVGRSTLAMGASDVMPDIGSLRLDKGTFRTNGFDDLLGTLFLFEGESAIDFGNGSSDLSFRDCSAFTWLGSVLLKNFNIGVDSLRFGTNADGLNDGQLSLIHLPGYSASLDDKGFVRFTAVPEPAHLGIAGLAALLAIRGMRKLAR
jgi:hypothetical protein